MAQVSPNPELWQSNSATQLSPRTATAVGVGTTAPLRAFEALATLSGGSFVGLQARETANGKLVTLGIVEIGGGTYPGIWLNQATPSVTNYAFLTDGYTIFNSPATQMSFRVGNANKMVVFASAGLSVGSSFFGTDPGANNLAVENNLGVGVVPPLNAEGWNKTIDLYGSSHAKLSVRSSAIEARINVHNTGLYGALAGMIVGTYSNHPVAFMANATTYMTLSAAGQLGIGLTGPTSLLHLAAGSAAANKAPLKFTTGVNLTTPESGTVEYDGTYFYLTP